MSTRARVALAFALCVVLLCAFGLPARACAQAESKQEVKDGEGLIYYLYLTACESCRAVSDMLDVLGTTVEMTRDGRQYQVALNIERINIGEQTDRALALFDAFEVPEDERLAPIILSGDSYYQGERAIGELIESGELGKLALSTAAETDGAYQPSASAQNAALNLGSAAVAGLVGGLNPCALSMLLLFISILINARTNVYLMTALFLLSKAVTYLLLGTALYRVFLAWNPTYLSLVARIALTVMALIFIGLNLHDAWAAYRKNYGHVANQLPAPLRRGLESVIRRMMEKGWLYTVILGPIVAAGEFLCAGQVYLATLLNTVSSGEASVNGIAALVIYCVCALIPMTITACAAIRCRNALSTSQVVLRNLPLIKLVSALFFVALLLGVWLLG